MATVELEKNSTGNLQRRYGYLFRLPSSKLSLIYASIPTIAIELFVRWILGAGIEFTILFAMATEVVLIFGIQIDNLALKRSNGIATFRRLSTISIISNTLWLVLSVVGVVVYELTKSDDRFYSLVILGGFFALSFRALVFGSIFYRTPIRGLPLAIVSPLILFFPIALSKLVSLYSINAIASLVGGLVAVVGIEVYLSSINKPVDGFKALQLLQAFLNAWTIDDPKDLEHYFQISSEEHSVDTTLVRLGISSPDVKNPAALLVVPGIHPGPFSPVGSSNLPGDIYESLKSPGTIPLAFHSISDHDLNLPSKEEVGKYTASLQKRDTIDSGKTMSLSTTVKTNKATASGFALGHTLLVTLTLAPNGMEDLPGKIREEITKESKKLGFRSSLIIDSHNSLGEKPDENDTLDLIQSAKQVLKAVSSAEQSGFNFGFAHSSELGVQNRADIGPAGIGLLLFEAKGASFCLVIVDANNAKIGFRASVVKEFETKSSTKILEICTSDTHVTAAKASNAKGYLALGDVSSPEEFAAQLLGLFEKAKSRLEQGEYSTSQSTSAVRTIGGEILNNFSGLLDVTSSVAKRGALALGVLAVLIVAAVAIL